MHWLIRAFLLLFGALPAWLGVNLMGEGLALAGASPGLLVLEGWMFGVVCFAFGSFMIYAALFAADAYTPEMRLGAEQNKRRWGIVDPEAAWRAGPLRSRGMDVIVVRWIAALGMTVLAMPALWVTYTRGVVARDLSYLGWFVVACAPVVFVSNAAIHHLRWRRYGTSTAELLRRPTATSEELRLMIRPDRAPLSPGDATVRLQLTTRVPTGRRTDNGSEATRPEVLWHESKSVPVSAHGLDVSFLVPADQPDASVMTAEEAAIRRFLAGVGWKHPDGFHWTLEVHQVKPGVDYHAVFDLPIRRS